MLAKCTFYRLMFSREANIRFSLNNLVNKGLYEGTPSEVDDVNIPDAHLNLSTITIVVPGETSFDYQYVWIQTGTQGQPGYKTSAWWVEDIIQVANSTPLIQVTLARDPWYDVLNFKRTIKGRFSALPTHEAPYLPLTIAQDTLVGKGSVELPTIRKRTDGGAEFAFVVITLSRSLIGNETGFFQYGVFTDMDYLDSSPVDGICKTEWEDSHNFIFPQLSWIINDPVDLLQKFNEAIGEKDIVDISISERCPWQHSFYSSRIGLFRHPENPDLDEAVDPVFFYDSIVGEPVRYGMYELNNIKAKEAVHDLVLGASGITSDFIRATGQIHLMDSMENLVAVIPSSLAGITLKVTTVLDLAGMTTYLRNDDLHLVYKFPEGHIPFNGSSWLDYLAKNREYDRECMQINIDKANSDAAIGVASGIASGAITGALTANPVVGVASAALNIGTTVLGRKVSIDSEKALQGAREHQYMIASSNNYNVGYGLSYILLSAKRLARVDIMLPYSVGTQADLEKYVKYNGYPAVGEFDVKMDTAGFYQGYAVSIYHVLAVIGTVTYMTYNKTVNDLLNEELVKGIRIIIEKGDI